MNLKLQIITLLVSFFFGIIFYIGVELNELIIMNKSNKIKNLIYFLYILVATLLYFLMMMKINHAVFHPYEILMMIIGYIVGYFLWKVIDSKYHICKYMTNKKNPD